eukprot:211834_1
MHIKSIRLIKTIRVKKLPLQSPNSMLIKSKQIASTTVPNHTKISLQSEKRCIIITLLLVVFTLLQIMHGIITNNKHFIQDINSYNLGERRIIFSTNRRPRIDEVYGLNSNIITEVTDPTKKYDTLHQYTVILRSSDPKMMTLDGFTSTLRSYLTLSTYKAICKFLCTKFGKIEKQDQVEFVRIRFKAPPHKAVDFNNIINIFKLNVLSDEKLIQIMGANVEENIMIIEEREDYSFEYRYLMFDFPLQYATLDIKDIQSKMKMTNILVENLEVYDIRDFKWQASFNMVKNKFDEHKLKIYSNKPIGNFASGERKKYIDFTINGVVYTDQIKLVRLG